MEEDNSGYGGTVIVSMELNDRYDDVVSKLEIYDDVVSKLEISDRTRLRLQNVTTDFEQLLDTVEAIDGGTKSVIVENPPDEMVVDNDSEAVVNALKVFEQYDLVTLAGNRWMIST